MKMNNLIVLFLALPATSIFAAQQINCDELAEHIKQKMDAVRPYAFMSSNNLLGLVGSSSYKPDYSDRTVSCAWSSQASVNANDKDLDNLLTSIKRFEKYQGALMRCVKKTTSPSPLAKKTMEDLQQKKLLIPKCITIYRQSVQTIQQKLDAQEAEMRTYQEKEKALDAFIDADDKD